jgi:hypothetical protein
LLEVRIYIHVLVVTLEGPITRGACSLIDRVQNLGERVVGIGDSRLLGKQEVDSSVDIVSILLEGLDDLVSWVAKAEVENLLDMQRVRRHKTSTRRPSSSSMIISSDIIVAVIAEANFESWAVLELFRS